MLECVVNVSEGRRGALVADIARRAGPALLDVHADPDHNRSVLTLAGPADLLDASIRAVARTAVDVLDLTEHAGVHPRFGVVDVVPFVDLDPDGRRVASTSAIGARNRFAQWAGSVLDLPCFLYGPERPLPEIRRHAFTSLMPDFGPAVPHPTAGATAVGARGVLIAYNLWLADSDLTTARSVAAALRGPSVRALGLRVGIATQVSCNLVNPDRLGPAEVYDFVASRVDVSRAELVGLVPAEVLGGIPVGRWRELDLDPARTIEARLEEAGLGTEGSGGG